MANIFLAPRSNETSHENFESSIVAGREYSVLEPFLTPEEKRALADHPVIKVWGCKESLRSRWEAMQTGDYVLFYARGSFYYSAKVIYTKFSPELARTIWKTDEDGEPWSCLFFVEDLQEIGIPIKVVQELADYEPTWDRVQGFMRLRESGVQAIIEKFGSIGAFLGQKPEVYEVIENIFEIAKDETLEEEQLEAVDKQTLLAEAAAFSSVAESHAVVTSPRKVRIENRKQKKRVAALEDYACQVCNWSLEWTNAKGKKLYRIDVDHIVEKAEKGGEELDNLWVLCPNCHVKKTLGVIKIDKEARTVTENGVRIELHHDNHLNW